MRCARDASALDSSYENVQLTVGAMDFSARPPSCSDYVHALEEERKKIQVFERELPLCLELVTHAIESVRRQMGFRATTSDGPVLEEFIPLKPSSTSSSTSEGISVEGAAPSTESEGERPDWLSSVRLWNQADADAAGKVADAPTKPIAVKATRVGGAFQAFESERHVTTVPPPAAASCSTASGGVGVDHHAGGDGEGKEEGQSNPPNRKVRRCWSPELHRRFQQALEQLGGPHAATPKQIRQVMKVDGLTNDEVKSHLQKYRLHNRRPGTVVHAGSNSSAAPIPQFVVVGGIWAPPADYSAAATTTTAAVPPADGPVSGIFAPVASLPSLPRFHQQQQQQQNEKTQSHRSPTGPQHCSKGRCGEENNTNSPATSSSQTTTASLRS